MEDAILRSLPKAVLHDHLDGGIRIATLLDLADDAGYRGLPTTDPVELSSWMYQGESGSLDRYLEAFEHTIAVMQTPDALSRVAYECVTDLADDGVVYAEIRFGPALHTAGGLGLEQVIEAVADGMERGRRATGLEYGLIIDAMRQDPDADPVARAAVAMIHAGVVGFDLSGPEKGHPPDAHLAECRYARESGLGLTLHAGEGDGPQSIWRAYGRCHAHRIGHGVRIIEDTVVRHGAIVAYGGLARTIRNHRVPLELCPTSNVHTGIAPRVQDHPLGLLYRAGFNVTLNTDNRLMSDVSMSDEFKLAVDHHGFTAADLENVTINALEAGFGSWSVRKRLIEETVRPAYAALVTAP